MTKTRTVLSSLAIFGVLLFGILGLLLLICLGRALTLQDHHLDTSHYYTGVKYQIDDYNLEKYINIFCGAIRYKTVSTAPHQYDREQLLKLKDFLRTSFPLVFNSSFIEVEDVNTYSLLLTIKGSMSSMKPYMLTSHMDVVPVAPDEWSLDPFLGQVVSDPVTGEKVIWGRGAVDDKLGVVGILSALEFLIMNGWVPTRSFYIGFGHDEEVTGLDGAAKISEVLEQRNVKLDFLLDEGLPITDGIITGLNVPVAAIGVSEKGRMNVRVSVEGVGGHSSIPPNEQAVGVLASALQRIYENPQPSMFGLGPEKDMISYLAPKVSWPHKLLFANTWLFGPVISYVMSRQRESNALLRTTTAITMVRAGVKDNIVPSSAWALLNHRVHPAQSLEEVLQHDIESVADDRVKVERLDSEEPHPVSPYGSKSVPYSLIVDSIKHTYPDVIAVPGLMIGNTDTIFYLKLTSNIYRFLPVILDKRTIGSIHGKDESITRTNFKYAITFYTRLVISAETVDLHTNFKPGRLSGEL